MEASHQNISIARKNKILRIEDKKEKERQIALWAVEFINEYHPIALPNKPDALIEFDDLNKNEQMKILNKPAFWQRDDVRTYLEMMSRVTSINRSNFEFLKTCLDSLKKEDQVQRKLIIDCLNGFRKEIMFLPNHMRKQQEEYVPKQMSNERTRKEPERVDWDE